MELLQTIFGFLLVLIVLVVVHEWGHFYVARLCGVKVLRFSVGIGKPFYAFHDKHGTEFALAPIPLGGYVRLLSRDDVGSADQAIESKPTWQRISVLLAGPLANIILAIIVFAGLFMYGTVELSPVVGKVQVNSPAARSGLPSGGEIVAVDGVSTTTRSQVLDRILLRLGETGAITFTVLPDDQSSSRDFDVDITKWLSGSGEPDPLGDLGFGFFRPQILPVVAGVLQGGAAEDVGLQQGDEILNYDGQPFESWDAFVSHISIHVNQQVLLDLRREAEMMQVSIVPKEHTLDNGDIVGRIGMYPSYEKWPEKMVRKRQYGPVDAVIKGVEKSWDTCVMIMVNIKKLLIGQISTKNLSGPIGIAKVAGDSARAGAIYYIQFLAILSVYLGVFNLLPIPILDGGQIVNCLIEAVKGGELSDRVKALSTQIGLAMMGVVMVVAFYNDILRLF